MSAADIRAVRTRADDANATRGPVSEAKKLKARSWATTVLNTVVAADGVPTAELKRLLGLGEVQAS